MKRYLPHAAPSGRAISRRRMLQASAVAAGWFVAPRPFVDAAERSPNERLNIACIGVGGRGAANVSAVSRHNLVAFCDVDQKRAAKTYQKFPGVPRFVDFRQMLQKLENRIDAVVISTPDHTHFHPALMAIRMGKHVYLEKPMAHSVWEVRRLTEEALRAKVATQLGVQRHTLDNVHRVVEIVQSGVLGTIREVHCWIGGSRGMPPKPTEFPAVPEHLDWDLWIGPARYRRYSPAYAPYNWRFWWDFGTGETGNWGCHILDIPFWALGLKYPTRVDASGPPVDPDRSPKSMSARFAFPAGKDRPPVTLHWYHAAKGPEILRRLNLPASGNNTLFIGSEGMLLCGFSKRALYPKDKFAAVKIDRTIPDSPGFHQEWLDACRGGPRPSCHFDYSGPLTETVLLGNAAYRARGGFDWDAAALKASGNDRAAQYLTSHFREGWEVA
ncbi:MAG: gfo/Idh/MocA family oxidoreductase [Planctomycetota bacterium]|nr:MAG: gfo/Idh/MocA family oxidoreductase [Planctomycetota bacterium]